jgi:hypothetical protein
MSALRIARVRVDDASGGKQRRERGRALIMANVRFTPESGHSLVAVQCPLSANSGLHAGQNSFGCLSGGKLHYACNSSL